ncbi:MAG: hypothetical protein IJG17_04980 [Eubacterium sp.]|nr:hypothetical protein [Eubacterium sp.]
MLVLNTALGRFRNGFEAALEEGELVFMHVLSDRKFEPLKDQETLNALYGIFQERHADLFEFE